MLAGDVILLYASLFITLKIRFISSFDIALFEKHLLPFTIIYLFWFLIFYVLDLYSLKLARNKLEFYKNSFTAISMSFFISILFFYTVPYFKLTPKTILIINSFIFLIFFYTWRYLFTKTILSFPVETILLVGENNDSKELVKIFSENPQLGYKTIMIKDAGEITDDLIKKVEIILPVFCGDKHIKLDHGLFERLFLKKGFFDFMEFFETTVHRIPLDSLEFNWMLEKFKKKRKEYDILQRTIDVTVSLILLIILSPLFLIIAFLIILTNGTPIIYKQRRTGKDNQPFDLIKFRTMSKDAEKNGAQFAKIYDQRVIPLGRFLRGWYLDELPQLINILKGEMSFVGPRPERPEFINEFSRNIKFYNLRSLIQPGLTGWAQLHYHYADSIEATREKLSYDLYYLKNRSIVLDSIIILKTMKNIIFRKGQ